MIPSRASQKEVTAAWGQWVAAKGPWHVFGALTYDQRRRPSDGRGGYLAPGHDVVFAHARRWLRESNRHLERRVEAAVLALEYQKNGFPHLHPLVRLSGGLLGNEFFEMGQTWYRDHGFAKLEAPRDEAAVAQYASKYLVKDLARGDVLLWPLRGPWPAHQPQFTSPAP